MRSPDFEAGEMIPSKFTCDGDDVSPRLQWGKGPRGTGSFALIMDDPDAPGGTFVHWILYDIPPPVVNLPEAVPPLQKLANAERHGKNSFGKLGYKGPCPPSGTHRYFFKIYALDTMLGLYSVDRKSDLERAMKGYILAKGELMAKYERDTVL